MSVGIARVLAVAWTDVRVRLRRPSTAILLALMAISAYFMIPEPTAKSGLLSIDGARALYTSSALAFATGSLLPFFLGLFGFYIVSNAIRTDEVSHVGLLVGATPVANVEYLVGKLLGSFALLGSLVGGFMVAAMGMQLVRGEGPLQPWVYISTYAVLALPCVLAVAVFALFFECVPLLRGRFGDVAYLFFWMVSLPLAIELGPAGAFFDTSGMGFLIHHVEKTTGTSNFSIGYSEHDSGKAPVEFRGITLDAAAVKERAKGMTLPAIVLPLSLLFFRRFDPARGKQRGKKSRRNPIALVEALVRPVSSRILSLLDRLLGDAAGRRPSTALAIAADLGLTLRLRPLLVLLGAVSTVLAFTLPVASLMKGALPVFFAALAITLADVPTRDAASGVTGLVYATPGTRPGYATLKLSSSLAAALLVTLAPALRLAVEKPMAAVSLLIGTALVAALAVLLGLATGTPKSFMAVYLAFWYLALNDGGKSATFDFAGWYGTATVTVQATYLAVTVGLAAATLALHRFRTERELG